MPDDGSVDREAVIAVLSASGVSVSTCDNSADDLVVTLAKGDRIETQTLPKQICRDMLHYLQYHFGVAIHLFYHPEMLRSEQTGTESPKRVQ